MTTFFSFRVAIRYRGGESKRDKEFAKDLQNIIENGCDRLHMPAIGRLRQDVQAIFSEKMLIVDFVDADGANKLCDMINNELQQSEKANLYWTDRATFNGFACTSAELQKVQKIVKNPRFSI